MRHKMSGHATVLVSVFSTEADGRTVLYIQGVHKGMVQFQKLTRNLFLTFNGHHVHRQQRQLSKFLVRYQRSLLMLTAGPRGQFPAGKGFLCAPF
jgi:hypothetical protein